MSTTFSRKSAASRDSNRLLEEVAAKSTTKIYNLEGVFSDEEVRVAWNALGMYLSKNLRMGRGVNVPRLGTFTLTPPQVRLNGVTNPEDRDIKPRNPVFIINKEFVRGKEIKSGIFYHQEFGSGIRAYTQYGATGEVPVAKINLTEVASYANMSKDSAELALNRVIKHLSEKTYASGSVSIEIPNIGTLIIRNNIAAVKFTEFIARDTRTVLSHSLDQRKKKANLEITSDNLKKFAALAETSNYLSTKPLEFLKIDDSTKNFIKTSFGFHFDDSHNLRRTVTGFDRSFATKPHNASMNNSQILKSRLSRSGFSNTSAFSRSIRYQSNLALQLVKEWAAKNHFNHFEKSFTEFMYLAKSVRDPRSSLTVNDVWQACKEISIDITEQQAHELFRVLDNDKDGVVSLSEWEAVFKDETNKQIDFILNHLRNKKAKEAEILSKTTNPKDLKEETFKQIVGSLEPDLKGQFTDQELVNAFKKYDWKSNLVTLFVDDLRSKFPTLHQAFKHLCHYNNVSSRLCFAQFQSAVKEVFGSRFGRDEILEIWNRISAGESTVGLDRFSHLFSNRWETTDPLNISHPRDEWVYKDFDIIKGTVTRSTKNSFAEKDDIETQCRKFADTVKEILRTSPKTLEQAFGEIDKEKKGVITNLEFKHAFRILNIALTSKEIDLLLNFCEFNPQKYINWKDFIRRFNLISQKKESTVVTAQSMMQRFSDLLHYYMITPKDAYRKYNNPNTGYMSFQEFYTLCKELYKIAKDSVLPDFPVIKTLFDFIDVRKDGRLDYQEWVQTFRNYNPPSLIQGTRAPNHDKVSKAFEESMKEPVRTQILPNFEQSQMFEELTKLIGRNRKYLLEKFQGLSEHPLVDFNMVFTALSDLVKQHGPDYPVEVYRNFIAFAMTGDKVDYKLLLEAFKQRSQVIQDFPKHKVF